MILTKRMPMFDMDCALAYSSEEYEIDGPINIILDDYAIMPERAHETDAGLDLKTPVDVKLEGNCMATINTGVHIDIPEGFCGLLVSKSGLNVNNGIQSTGLIDAGYTGSIRVKLYNYSEKPKQFLRGDKISQLVLIPIWIPKEINVVQYFDDTDRGSGGFGSTGR